MTNQDREEMLKLAERLIEYAGNNGFSHADYADSMRQAGNCLERLARSPAPAVSAEPCGIVGELSGSAGGFTFAAFHAKDVPIGSKLYLHSDPKVAELEAELASAKDWRDASERRLEEVLLENAALRKDAERYRWLTSGKRRDYVSDCVLSKDEWEGHLSLSEAIDAAIAIAKESNHD